MSRRGSPSRRRRGWASLRVALAATLVVAASGAGCGPRGPLKLTRATVVFEQAAARLTLQVEVASTEQARQRGLMGRKDVPAGTGMLFTYPGAAPWGGFWMKDTLIPLDIAFLRQGVVTEVDRMEPCRADPCPVTVPAGSYDGAVEASAGTFAAAGIGAGAAVRVTG